MRLLIGVSIAALAFASPGSAQRQPTPEQRIEQLERQLRQVQGRVFQRGQPADTAGFDYEPAAPLSAVTRMADRITALERQMAEIQRISEENGNRLRSIENSVAQARSEQSGRLSALERRVQELASAPVATADPLGTAAQPGPGPGPGPATQRPPAQTTPSPAPANSGPAAPADDPGEAAYTEGFRLWESGRYAEAITSLRAFTKAYPNHRRLSWARNLAGRALLDSGQPREAANALLENYRSNPRGERAADSLFYLGQSLMQLGQPTQACNAYAELQAVYGSRMRAELQRLLPEARAQAKCS